MRKTLTDKGVAALKPRAKRYSHPDPELRGLWIRVMPSGTKSYTAVPWDPNGKQHWITFATTDAMSIEDAREQARTILRRVRAGLSAFEPKAESFGAVVASWRKRHVEANALRSADEINRLLDVHVLPRWKDREFTTIGRSDVTTLLDKVEDKHGARQADYVLNVARSIMNWYATRHDTYNPPIVRGMKRDKAQPRERVLADAELRAVWNAAASGGTFGALVCMCLLTAQRSRKVAAMAWADIADGAWSVPKQGREKDTGGTLVLPAAARTILAGQPKLNSNGHVFAGRGEGPYQGFSAGKVALDKKLPATMAPWTIHDLRRTARSLLSRAGVASDIAERVMGHAKRGVEGIYDRHAYRAEKADALARLATLIDAIVHPQDNVVALGAQKNAKRGKRLAR